VFQVKHDLEKGVDNLANHKSAEKRARQNEKRRVRNKAVKTRVKHLTKEVRLASGGASKEEALAKLKAAQAVVDKALKKGVIHQKTAARKISRLSKLVNTFVVF
jgi:small subunit ribosomal protein S20